MKMAILRTGLNGLRMKKALVELNRNIVRSLPTIINVCRQKQMQTKISHKIDALPVAAALIWISPHTHVTGASSCRFPGQISKQNCLNRSFLGLALNDER